MSDSKLEQLIKRDENEPLYLGDESAGYAHWDGTGQRLWDGLRDFMGDEAWHSAREHLGKLTEGYGRLLEIRRPKEDYDADVARYISRAVEYAIKYDWFAGLGPPHVPERWFVMHSEDASCRQAVIISMIFQLGPTGFAGFKKMISAIEQAISWEKQGRLEQSSDEFGEAAEEMLDSKWARQTPSRAQELAKMMRTGEWPSDIQA